MILISDPTMVDANSFPEDEDADSTFAPGDDQDTPDEDEEDPIMRLHRQYFGRRLSVSSTSSDPSFSGEEEESQGAGCG